MATRPNEYHLVVFDPGGITGWAHFVIDCKAFSRPEHKVLRWLKSWDCGEFSGQETDQLRAAVALIHSARFEPMPFATKTDVLSEDFDLVQMVGGKNLLSPVRINAVLEWECNKLGIKLQYQQPQRRTSVTPERLELFGFKPPKRRWTTTGAGKDAFSAMQHGIIKLRSIKEVSRSRPWKLSDGISSNAVWDCACKEGKHCDLTHPK